MSLVEILRENSHRLSLSQEPTCTKELFDWNKNRNMNRAMGGNGGRGEVQ